MRLFPCYFSIFKSTSIPNQKAKVYVTNKKYNIVSLFNFEINDFRAPEFSPGFSRVRVTRSLVLCVVFCRSLLAVLSFYLAIVLSVFSWIPIAPLVSLISSFRRFIILNYRDHYLLFSVHCNVLQIIVCPISIVCSSIYGV